MINKLLLLLFFLEFVALANQETYDLLLKVSNTQNRTVFIPQGALWGGEDIRRMASSGTLTVN